MVNGVSLNSFLAAAQQNPDGNVRLSSDGTDVKATNSFFRKAVNWMSGNNHQTREVFAQALADEYGPDAAQFAFDQAGGGGEGLGQTHLNLDQLLKTSLTRNLPNATVGRSFSR